MLEDGKKEIEALLDSKDSSIKNELYCPVFVLYLLQHYFPFLPLWTALLIALIFGINKDSNAPVEVFFKHLKIHIWNKT